MAAKNLIFWLNLIFDDPKNLKASKVRSSYDDSWSESIENMIERPGKEFTFVGTGNVHYFQG